MIKEKKSLKGKSPSRRKFFKAAAATGVAAVADGYGSHQEALAASMAW